MSEKEVAADAQLYPVFAGQGKEPHEHLAGRKPTQSCSQHISIAHSTEPKINENPITQILDPKFVDTNNVYIYDTKLHKLHVICSVAIWAQRCSAPPLAASPGQAASAMPRDGGQACASVAFGSPTAAWRLHQIWYICRTKIKKYCVKR